MKKRLEYEIEGKDGREYRFIVDAETMRHLKRHFPRYGESKGSQFTYFRTIAQALRYAIDTLKEIEYEGEKKVVEVDFPYEVGLDGIARLDELPEGAEIREEERHGRKVKIVYGAERKPTNHIVMVFGPLEEGCNGIYTMFPGKNAPPLPVGRETLEEWGYEGEELEEALKVNEEYKKFWEKHAFVG